MLKAQLEDGHPYHQSFIVTIGFMLTPMQLGPVCEPLLVIVGTIGGGCLLLHEIVRRIPLSHSVATCSEL